MPKLLIFFSVVFSLMGQTVLACDARFSQRVYVLLGRNESSLNVYSGNVVVPGADESKVEFQSCSPTCFRWVNNCAFFSSRSAALDVSRKMDEGHTSFLEGAAMAGGALILLGILGSVDSPPKKAIPPKKVDPYARQSSSADDTTLQGMD